MNEPDHELYDIGAVSRLTGLSSPNLRVWERRYGLVEPVRSDSNRRQYTADDIRRITLVKTLSDRGHAIGSVAGLSIKELEERVREEARLGGIAATGQAMRRKCRAIVIGSELLGLLEGREAALKGVELVGRHASIDGAKWAEAVAADLLLVATPTLFPETVASIQSLVARSGALRAVVVYRFAESRTTRQIDKDLEHVTAVRFPLDFNELQLISRAEILALSGQPDFASPAGRKVSTESAGVDAPLPARRFSDGQLAKIARSSTAIECECPHHLAELLGGLNAFAKYSEECESRNAEDAEMHAYLHRMTVKARAVMEEALEELVRFESIDIE